MASGAVVGEIGLHVTRVRSTLKIRLVAGKTIGRRIGKTAAHVAFRTIRKVVPFGQREKIVIHLIRTPTGLKKIMAFLTIG